jgi:GGDEF domain-containing protein
MEMKKKSPSSSVGGSFVAAICIVIYLLALVQGTVRAYLSIEECKTTAEKEFSNIVDLALSAGIQGFMDERFDNTIKNALSSYKSLEALIITGPDGGKAYEKKQGYAVSWVNDTPRFKNKFYFFSQNLYKPLAILDLRNANIKAVANAFNYPEIIKIMKETLLIILIGFSMAFFTFMLQLLLVKSSKPEVVVYNHPPESKEGNITAKTSTSCGPKGLYSPRSGLGWEEYIKDRLNSELHRCSSTEKELTLILLEFTGISEEWAFKQAAEETAAFFTSKDLIFEYGDYGISIILPYAGFEAAFAMSEKFYQRIVERFPQSGTTAHGLCIGLSSRLGRLINADRLLLEAGEALRKAKNDSRTSIIAFKSDPERYRAFIASQNRKRF